MAPAGVKGQEPMVELAANMKFTQTGLVKWEPPTEKFAIRYT